MESKKKSRHRRHSLQPKLIASLVLLSVVLMISLTTVIVTVYRSQMEGVYAQEAFQHATIAAELIDGDSISRYYNTGEKDDYYYQVQHYLQTVRQNAGLEYFYVVVPEEDRMVYIWDTGEGDGVCDLLDSDAYYGGGKELMHQAFAVNAENNILITKNEKYGYLASAYVAILDSSGQPVALASVDMSMARIDQNIRTAGQILLTIFFAVLLLSVVAFYFCVRRVVISPVKSLHQAANQLAQSDMKQLEQFSISLQTGDEFEQLGDAFVHVARELAEYFRNLTEITAEKERIGAELNIAAQIQSSMLPGQFPAFPDRNEFDIYATMHPAKEVGGDFYDFFLVDEKHIAIVMADVSGKGVPAALFMVIGKTLIKDHTQAGCDLGQVFSEVNNLLCEANSEGLFITAFEGVLNLENGEFRFVNAGHEPPAIYRKDTGYQLQPIRPGFVLAGMEGMRYRCATIQLEPGDRIFLYTDGVTEAANRNQEMYGRQRLLDVLNRNTQALPQQLLERVRQDMAAFVGEEAQADDITMLCLEYKERMEQADGRTDH